MSKKEYQSWVEFIASGSERLEVLAKGKSMDDIDIVVCRLAPQGQRLLMPDNLLGHCSKCFRMVQFRPHAPKEPQRVCDECARPLIIERKKTEEIKFVITENTAADLVALAKKKGLQ